MKEEHLLNPHPAAKHLSEIAEIATNVHKGLRFLFDGKYDHFEQAMKQAVRDAKRLK